MNVVHFPDFECEAHYKQTQVAQFVQKSMLSSYQPGKHSHVMRITIACDDSSCRRAASAAKPGSNLSPPAATSYSVLE
jgi:hypothetical protein